VPRARDHDIVFFRKAQNHIAVAAMSPSSLKDG
jgi:hypothetical protein